MTFLQETGWAGREADSKCHSILLNYPHSTSGRAVSNSMMQFKLVNGELEQFFLQISSGFLENTGGRSRCPIGYLWNLEVKSPRFSSQLV